MGERIELLRWVPPSATIEKAGQAEERKGREVAGRASRCRLSRVPTLQSIAMQCNAFSRPVGQQIQGVIRWTDPSRELRVEGSGKAEEAYVDGAGA